ncbi:hypothetical protein ACOJM8_000977 [Klebsiella aerogenes]|nr:hypothetical protein [Klebsiella aerogenes]
MDKFKGTPGPWNGKDVGVCNQDRVGLQLGFIMSFDDERVAECTANAQLIAAAPDLLEALQDMLSGWKYIREQHGDLYGVGWDRSQNKAVEAINKSLGK